MTNILFYLVYVLAWFIGTQYIDEEVTVPVLMAINAMILSVAFFDLRARFPRLKFQAWYDNQCRMHFKTAQRLSWLIQIHNKKPTSPDFFKGY